MAPQLPTPETCPTWPSPDVASQWQLTQFFWVSVLGAWTWDLLWSLREECLLLFKHRFTLTQGVYLLARISSGAFIIMSVVYVTMDTTNCTALLRSMFGMSVISIPSNGLLMLLRLRAVYWQSRLVVSIFALLWVAVLASCLATPFLPMRGAHIGTTLKCITTEVHSSMAMAVITFAVYNTLVFFAISHRLLIWHTDGDTWSSRLKCVIDGKGMTVLPRLLLRTGLFYYLATAGMSIVTAVILIAPSVSGVYHELLAVPCTAIENIIAARTYRHVKLGLLLEVSVSDALSTGPIRFNDLGSPDGTRDNDSIHIQEQHLHTSAHIMVVSIPREERDVSETTDATASRTSLEEWEGLGKE